MDQEQWLKVTEAKTEAWGSMRNPGGDTWPVWVNRLDAQLQLWLEGEEVVNADFGFGADSQGILDDAFESEHVWAVILSTRMVVRIDVRKHSGSQLAGTPSLTVVPRSKIRSLSAEVQPQGGFVSVAEFEGIDEPVRIPADRFGLARLTPDVQVAIFTSLREDLLGGD